MQKKNIRDKENILFTTGRFPSSTRSFTGKEHPKRPKAFSGLFYSRLFSTPRPPSLDGMSYANYLVEGAENDPEHSAVKFLTQLAGTVSCVL